MNFVWIVAFIRLAVLTTIVGNLQMLHQFGDSQNLKSAFNEIIKNIVVDRFPVVNIIRATNFNFKVEELINDILLESKAGFKARLDNYRIIEHRPKKFNIIFLDDINSFRILNNSISPEVFHYRGIYLFVLINGMIEEVEEIFATLWKKNMYNVDVVFEAGDLVDVLTFLPFGTNICEDTTPRRINSFINGSFTNDVKTLFPDKFKNMANCPFRISTFEDHLSVIKTKRSDGSFELSGFDMDLMNELSKALNFKKVIEFYESEHPWGTVQKNGSVDGALGEVVRGKADMAIGRYYLQTARAEVADSSVAYYNFPEVFVVSPGRSLSSFEKLLQPFDSIVWILLFASFGAVLAAIFILKTKLENLFEFENNHPVTNVIISILGGSQPKLPKRTHTRLLLMTLLIFCLVTRSAYQGSLYKFLQTDGHHKGVESIDDMIEQEFDIYILGTELNIFENNSKVASRVKFIRGYQQEAFLDTPLTSKNRTAFVNSMTNIIYANMKHKNSFVHKICREYLLTVNVVIYFRKDYFLVEAINKKISIFQASGIMSHLISRYVDLRYWHVKTVSKGPQRLSLQHLDGAMSLWLILIVIAFITFLVEICIAKFLPGLVRVVQFYRFYLNSLYL